MIPVPPSTKTTLVLTASFHPIGFFSARSTIRNIMVGGVKAVDYHGNIYDWSNWVARTDFELDQPSLRSAKAEFPVPTIVAIPGFFGHFANKERKRTRTSSLRQIYNMYDGICAYCLNEISFKHATRDHSLPKSKGGVNHDDNIVLSCKKCNNKKGSRFPFSDANGNNVKPKVLGDVEFMIAADNIPMRDEWRSFIKEV